jgi:hypothetical protein
MQYNNQWMIVDYSLFTPLQPVPDGTLWIIEQVPGKTRAADVTDFLRRNGRQARRVYPMVLLREIMPLMQLGQLQCSILRRHIV